MNIKENNKVFLSLGSNIEDRFNNLQNAIKELQMIAKINQISSIYETEPEDLKNQNWYLNLCLEIVVSENPEKFLRTTQEIEKKLGRKEKNLKRPRIIDIDILLYGKLIYEKSNLIIPHPRMHLRNFVLTPLTEIASTINHPKLQKSILELKNNLKNPKKVKLWTQRKLKI